MDYAVIFATLMGPILAVQAQKWIERRRERRDKQIQIFTILMSTRALRGNSMEHVQALNSINLFFRSKIKREKPIIDAWNIYFDHLQNLSPDALPEYVGRWNEQGENYLIDLLAALSVFLNYDFDKVQLKRGVYHPRGQQIEQMAQAELRENFSKVLKGDQAIKMDVIRIPSNSE